MGSQFPPKPKVLIVEDEFVIADFISEIVEESGCEVVGPFGTLPEAMQACRSADADAAIVDLALRGELAYPIAEVLTRRGIPVRLRHRARQGRDGKRVGTAPVSRQALRRRGAAPVHRRHANEAAGLSWATVRFRVLPGAVTVLAPEKAETPP